MMDLLDSEIFKKFEAYIPREYKEMMWKTVNKNFEKIGEDACGEVSVFV